MVVYGSIHTDLVHCGIPHNKLECKEDSTLKPMFVSVLLIPSKSSAGFLTVWGVGLNPNFWLSRCLVGPKKNKVAQSCLTLWDSMDYSPPRSSVHGIFQARILERVAIPFSRGSSQPRNQTRVSCIAGRFFTIWATKVGPREFLFLTSSQVMLLLLGTLGSMLLSLSSIAIQVLIYNMLSNSMDINISFDFLFK